MINDDDDAEKKTGKVGNVTSKLFFYQNYKNCVKILQKYLGYQVTTFCFCISGLLCDLLWSDPDKDVQGWGENDRGVSFTFGADVVSKFLNRHDLDLICRAHQVKISSKRKKVLYSVQVEYVNKKSSVLHNKMID